MRWSSLLLFFTVVALSVLVSLASRDVLNRHAPGTFYAFWAIGLSHLAGEYHENATLLLSAGELALLVGIAIMVILLTSINVRKKTL